MLKQMPIIAQRPLTKGWDVIVRYRVRNGGEVIEALEKYDVTDQVKAIQANAVAEFRRRQKKRKHPAGKR